MAKASTTNLLGYNIIMRRQLNLKAAGVLLTIVVLLAVGLTVLHSYQVVRNAAVLLAQADKALEGNQPEPEKALRYLNLYLTYQPNDLDARTKYGLTLEKYARGPADFEQAVQALDTVLRRDPGRKELRFRMMHCLINLQRRPEAIEQGEKLLPDFDRKAKLEHILGWCCEADKQYSLAAKWFEKAIADDPHQIESYKLLVDVLQLKKDAPEKSLEVVDALVKANPKDFRAYLVSYRARLLLNKENKPAELERAKKDLQQAIALAPQEPEVVWEASEALRIHGKAADARTVLKKGLEQNPENADLYLALAQLEINAGHLTAALDVLRSGVLKLPQHWDLLVLLTDLTLDLKELAPAEKNVADLRRLRASSPLLDFFQARLCILKRQWPEAIALLERTREHSFDTMWNVPVHLQLGWCYRQTGDAEQQLLAFARAAKEQPNLPFAHAGLGSALLTLGRLDKALEHLQKAVASAPVSSKTQAREGAGQAVPPETWTDLARCLMLRNLRLPEKDRNWDESNQAIKQAAQRQKRNVEIVILQAEIDMAQKKFASAGKLLEAARTEFPKSTALECALADLLFRQQDFAGALAVLDRADKVLGQSVEIRQARLRVWGGQAGARSRLEVKKLGENLEKFTAADRARLLRDLAETWVRLSDPKSAEQCWRRLIEAQPSDLRARLALLELCLQSGKIDAARQIVADLRKIEGEKGINWHYGAAALLLAESLGSSAKLDQARKHLAECYRSGRDWGRLPVLEGQIDESEGKYDDAIKHYQDAFKLGERTPRLVYRLVRLLQERRKFAEAWAIFRDVEEQGPLQPEMGRLGAELALAGSDLKRALVLGQQSVPGNSQDFRDYLWLARLYQADNQFDKANEQLRYAVGFAPQTPETWVASVENLVLSGGIATVPLVLSELQKKIPPDLLAFTLARCNEVLGRFDLAEQYFRKAVAQHPDDFALQAKTADFFRQSDQPAKAVPFLQKLLDSASTAPFPVQAAARQQLALILAGTGQSDGVRRALDLLSVGNYPDDECTRYLVLAFDPAKRGEAVKSFEELRKRFPVSSEELFYLAKSHEAAGKMDLANKLLRDLVTSYSDNPQYLAHFTRNSLQNGDANGAASYCQKLQMREPESPRTQDLKAQVAKLRR